MKKETKGVCEECKKEFVKKNHNQIVCSDECKAIRKARGKRLARKSATVEQKEKERLRKRNYWKRHGSELYKEKYKTDYNQMRTKKIFKNKEMTIGLLIKSIILKTPIHGSKFIWEGVGDWSKKYDCCVECNTTIYKHSANGICGHCYQQLRNENLNSEQKSRKRLYKAGNVKYLDHISTKKNEALKWIEKAFKNEFGSNSQINNLLSNLK